MKKTLFFFITLFLLSVQVYAAGWPDNFCGQIAWHISLDNNATQGRVNTTGTLVNAPTLQAGKVGLAYNFSKGNQYINFGDNAGFEFNNLTGAAVPLSMTTWVLPTRTDINQAPVSKSNYSSSKTYDMYFSSTTQGNSYVWDATLGGEIGKIKLLELTTGWHLYSMTYAGGTSTTSMRLQKDGVDQGALDDSGGTFIQIRDTSSPLVIGALSDPQFFTNGTIDEVTLWNVNLSESNLTYLYNSSNGVNLTSICFTATPAAALTLSNINVTTAYLNNTGIASFNRDCSPTVTLTLNSVGSCAMSKYQLNYSQMLANSSNQLCSTTNATSQTCTLPDAECIPEQGYTTSTPLYLACENNGSTAFANFSKLNLSQDFKFNGTVQYKTSAVKINESRVSLIPEFLIPSTFVLSPTTNEMFTGWNTTTSSTGAFSLFSPFCLNYTVSVVKTKWNGSEFVPMRNESGDTEYHITAPCP